MQDLKVFFEPEHFIELQGGRKYHPLQWGSKIKQAYNDHFNIEGADIVLVGCGEWRGEREDKPTDEAANLVREQLYELYHWHQGVTIADLGNIRMGHSINDTKAALLEVLKEVNDAGKIAIVLGGSHDLTLVQYDVFRKKEQMSVAVVADMLIDIEESEATTSRSFLMDMLTDTPNFISHFSHIAFQSYYTQPRILETLDKLRFDFFRLGKVKEDVEEMEPVLRPADFFSFDISAVRFGDAPANINGSPNGLSGEEACTLTRYAGMAENLSSLGIFGFDSANDSNNMTAKLISQMIWYFVDGYLVRKSEAKITDKEEFMIYNVVFTDNDAVFIKSKRTNRWWMRLPDNAFIPCSYKDYINASSNEIPERWLREQERLV